MRDIYLPIDNFITCKRVNSIPVILSEVESPDYTIFIPTYKRASTLKTTIESAINQECTENYEIVIINNDPEGVNGETRELIESFRDKRISYYVNEENIGLCGNWNRGVELSRGRYISMIHDDDMLSPWFLSSVVRAIRENENPLVIGVSFFNFDSSHMPQFKAPEQSGYRVVTKKSFFFGRYINIAGMTVKREFILQQGGYRDEYYPNEDSILIYQAVMSGKVINIEHELAGYRQEVNLSLSEKTMREIILKTEKTRRMIAKHEGFAGRWMRRFDREYLYSYIETANRHWNHSMDWKELMKECGFEKPGISRFKLKMMNALLKLERRRR
ncbi:MAG: glycosyltransferase [Lachnospiraceae bacterium]|nr:glycosyltransferase [Lachnospiraceae bacterium]